MLAAMLSLLLYAQAVTNGQVVNASSPVAAYLLFSFGELALFGLVAMMAFLFLITVPFVYEWRRGGFEWD